jgi:hypothetical protein
LLQILALQAPDLYAKKQAIPNSYRAAFLFSGRQASFDRKAKDKLLQ